MHQAGPASPFPSSLHSVVLQSKQQHLNFLSNEPIQPASVNAVLLEAFCFQQFNQVLNGGSEIPSDGQLLQSHYHVSEREKNPFYLSHTNGNVQADNSR